MVIVDDDPKFCETLGDILQTRGFGVTKFTDPHNLMERVRVEGEVVLLDMKLDNISGLEVVKEIEELLQVLTKVYHQDLGRVLDQPA